MDKQTCMIEVIIDETGTLTKLDLVENYGAGFIFYPQENRNQIEKELNDRGLNSIHMKEVAGYEQKLLIANQIGEMKLERFGLVAGSIIQTSNVFAETVSRRAMMDSIATKPELVVEHIRTKLNRRMRKKKILLPEDLFPGLFSQAKILEVMTVISRIPVAQLMMKHPDADVEILWSAIGMDGEHQRIVDSSIEATITGLNEFLVILREKKKDFPPPPKHSRKISMKTQRKNDGVFGLADFFAYVGRLLSAPKQERNFELGKEMYEATKALYSPQLLLEPSEPFPGIYQLDYKGRKE